MNDVVANVAGYAAKKRYTRGPMSGAILDNMGAALVFLLIIIILIILAMYVEGDLG